MKAYKMVRKGKDGRYYPLFVNANEPFVVGKWMEAESGPRLENGKVKSKLGGLAYRPGFHCSAIPYVKHIGKKGPSGTIEWFYPDVYWAEVEVSDDIDYQPEANRNGYNPRTGRFNPRDADLDHIPENGYYRYKTNPNMEGEWVIAGGMKVNRILSDDEVRELCAQHGYTPLPRYPSDARKRRGLFFTLLERFRKKAY